MTLKEKNELFNVEAMCDSKHKLNTTNKDIPLSVVSDIETKGLSIEQIDELIKSGYDIYKYHTQITLHGVCKELSKGGRLDNYKCLTLNKNQSIGIRWIAIDRQKKREIVNKLHYFGWSSEDSSTALYPRKCKRCSTQEDAIKLCNEWNNELKGLDKSLFFGRYSIYYGFYMYSWYACCDIYINGIYSKNVDKVVEQITGKSIKEVNSYIADVRAKEEESRRKCDEEYERRRIERERRNAEEAAKLKAKLEEGFIKTTTNKLAVGTIFYVVRRNYLGEYKARRYKMDSRRAFPCYENGDHDSLGEKLPNAKTKEITCYVRK